MSIRSTTGCYGCKTRRKKCDEAKPKCFRCTKSKIDCEYEYIQPGGRNTKKRTKPAPRPASELAKKLEKQKERSTVAVVPAPAGGSQPSHAVAGLFDYPLVPSLDISLPLDTDWNAALYPPSTMPSLDPLVIRAVPSPFAVSQKAIAPRNLTPNQASLFNALFSLGETNYPHRANSPRGHALTHPPPHAGPSNYAPQHGRLNSYSPPTSSPDSQLDDCEEDSEDPEGIGQILCQPPLVLDRTADGNSLPFVLQSFGQWLPLSVFDPLRVIHLVKHDITHQFVRSPALRSRLLLFAEIVRSLVKSWTLDKRGKELLKLVTNSVWRNIADYQLQTWPPSEQDRQRARAALDHTLELIGIQVIASPLSHTLRLLQSEATVFLAACPYQPPCLFDILLGPEINLKHFAALDVATSITTGRSPSCRYHVPWSLELCDEFVKRREDQGLQWLLGIPDQFIMLFAYLNSLKQDAEATETPVDPRIIARVEADIRMIVILPPEGKDPSLAIGRMVVQECWREAVFIYLYMALCGAHAFDPRVEKAQTGFMRLVNGIKPGRNPDAFLIIPMLIASVATTKLTHRQIIRSRILSLPDCAIPNTAGNDSLLILEDVWTRTELEGRVAQWDDLREACRRVTGV
ncbi:hypothetical protein OPQ81_009149 [Rhizoctonia solani]|nr:hypothetical protein OPQ81_009149 [Rhizoctonia solani]